VYLGLLSLRYIQHKFIRQIIIFL